MLTVPHNTKIFILETGDEKSSVPSFRASVQISKWAATQNEDKWVKIDVRDTEKGPLIVEMIKCKVQTGHRNKAGVATEMAIAIRYIDRDQSVTKQDYYLSNAESTTSDTEFARVA